MKVFQSCIAQILLIYATFNFQRVFNNESKDKVRSLLLDFSWKLSHLNRQLQQQQQQQQGLFAL